MSARGRSRGIALLWGLVLLGVIAAVFANLAGETVTTDTVLELKNPESERPEGIGIELRGIVIIPGRSLAMLERRNSKTVIYARKGQKVGDWMIERILPDRVVLSRGEARQELKLSHKAGWEQEAEKQLSAAEAEWQAEEEERLAAAKAEWQAEADKRLAETRDEWKAEIDRRIADANTAFRAEGSESLATVEAKRKATLDKRLAKAEAEWQADEKKRLADAEAKRKKQSDARMAALEAEWRAQHNQRLARTEAEWRIKTDKGVDDAKTKWERQAETSLAAAKAEWRAGAEKRLAEARAGWEQEAEKQLSAATVKMQVTKKDPTKKTPTRTGAAPAGYPVQLGAFRSERVARQEMARIVKANRDLLGDLGVAVRRADLGAKGVFHRVRTGPLPARKEARTLCVSLSERKVPCFVVSAGKR